MVKLSFLSYYYSKFSLTGSWIDSKYDFHEKVLAVHSFLDRHTAININAEIDRAFEKLNIDKTIAVVGATRDGARNMAAACRLAELPRF